MWASWNEISIVVFKTWIDFGAFHIATSGGNAHLYTLEETGEIE